MKVFKGSLEKYKNKKDLMKILQVHKDFISKKTTIDDLNSALDKTRSAIIIIKEYQEKFHLEKELEEFTLLNEKISSRLKILRSAYVRRFNKILNEEIEESNLEVIMKSMAKLKGEVDQNLKRYNLRDIQSGINRYFEFIKRLYIIFSSYLIVNYEEMVETIFEFKRDLEFEEFPNMNSLIEILYHKLILRKLKEISNHQDQIKIRTLSEKMTLTQEELLQLIDIMMEMPDNPIKVFNSSTQEIIFKIG